MTRDRRVWLAWAVFGLALGSWLATLVGYVALKPNTGDWGGASLLANLPFVLMILAFDVIGVLITTRRPGNAIGWLVLLIGLSWSAGDLLNAFGQYGFEHGWSNADVLIALSSRRGSRRSGSRHLPDPALPRWPPAVATVAVVRVDDRHRDDGRGLVLLLAPGTFEDSGYPTVSNPLGIEALRSFEGLLLAGLLIIPIGMLGSMVALVQRYRRSAGAERQQMKWLAYAAAVAAFTYAGAMVGSLLKGSAARPRLAAGVAEPVARDARPDPDRDRHRGPEVPALRHRPRHQQDDRVRRAGRLHRRRVRGGRGAAGRGDRRDDEEPGRCRSRRRRSSRCCSSPCACACSAWANRFVYGERATPYEVLSRFSDRIAGTYATEDVLPRTARVIAEGTGAERVGVWLRVGDTLHERGAWPAADRTPAPVAMAGQELPEFPGTAATVPSATATSCWAPSPSPGRPGRR